MEPVIMSPGTLVLTYVLIGFAGAVIGAFGFGGLWLFFQYRELLSAMKNFTIKDIEIVE